MKDIPASTYRTTRYQKFVQYIESQALQLNVNLKNISNGRGWFKGSQEPCALVTVKKADKKHIKQLASDIARQYNQEAVRMITPGNGSGRMAIFDLKGHSVAEITSAMTQAGVYGAMVSNYLLILAEPDGKIPAIDALKSRYGEPKVYRCHVERVKP